MGARAGRPACSGPMGREQGPQTWAGRRSRRTGQGWPPEGKAAQENRPSSTRQNLTSARADAELSLGRLTLSHSPGLSALKAWRLPARARHQRPGEQSSERACLRRAEARLVSDLRLEQWMKWSNTEPDRAQTLAHACHQLAPPSVVHRPCAAQSRAWYDYWLPGRGYIQVPDMARLPRAVAATVEPGPKQLPSPARPMSRVETPLISHHPPGDLSCSGTAQPHIMTLHVAPLSQLMRPRRRPPSARRCYPTDAVGNRHPPRHRHRSCFRRAVHLKLSLARCNGEAI